MTQCKYLGVFASLTSYVVNSPNAYLYEHVWMGVSSCSLRVPGASLRYRHSEPRIKFTSFKAFHGVEPNRCLVFTFSKAHGAVRFCFLLLRIQRCGSVRFIIFQDSCAAVENRRVRCGSVKNNKKPNSTVPALYRTSSFKGHAAFSLFYFCESRTVRCGADFKN